MSSYEKKSDKIKCKKMRSKTAPSVMMWSREGDPSAESRSLPLMGGFLRSLL